MYAPPGEGEVGAKSASEILDFRSRMGVFGPGSLQVVVNKYSQFAYADVDRWNPYEGLGPLVMHFLFELVF